MIPVGSCNIWKKNSSWRLYRIIHFQLEFLFEISIPEDSLWKILKKVAFPVGFLKFSIFTLYSIDWNFFWIAIQPEKMCVCVCVWGGWRGWMWCMCVQCIWTLGGTDQERGYGDVRPWRPPFHASPAACKGPISSKRVSSQDPLLRKFGNFSLNSLNFHPNFSSQAPKFGNFQLTSPQVWKFLTYKPPNLEIFRSQAPLFRGKCQFATPTLRKPGPHTPTWKKVECPPPRMWTW